MDIRDFLLLIPPFSTPVFEWAQRIQGMLTKSSVDIEEEIINSRLNTVLLSKLPLNVLQLMPGNILPAANATLQFLLQFDRPLASPRDILIPSAPGIQLKPSHLFQQNRVRTAAAFPINIPSSAIDALAWAAVQDSLGASVQLILPTLNILHAPTDEQLEILDRVFLKSVARPVSSQVTVNSIQPLQFQAPTIINPYSPSFEGTGCQFLENSVAPNTQYVAGLSGNNHNPNIRVSNPNFSNSCNINDINTKTNENNTVNSRLSTIEACLCKISESLSTPLAQNQSRSGDNFVNFDENRPNPNHNPNPNPNTNRNPSFSNFSGIPSQSWKPSGAQNAPRALQSAPFQSRSAWNSNGLRESIRPQEQAQTGLCYYHSNFGMRARSCIQPCNFNAHLNL